MIYIYFITVKCCKSAQSLFFQPQNPLKLRWLRERVKSFASFTLSTTRTLFFWRWFLRQALKQRSWLVDATCLCLQSSNNWTPDMLWRPKHGAVRLLQLGPLIASVHRLDLETGRRWHINWREYSVTLVQRVSALNLWCQKVKLLSSDIEMFRPWVGWPLNP